MRERDLNSLALDNPYLDLLKRAVSNYLYFGGDTPFDHFEIADFYERGEEMKAVVPETFLPHSLLAAPKLNALQSMLFDIAANNVPGDLVEAGIYKGGTVIFMRGFLKAYGITDRIVWGADSFEGIPMSTTYAHMNDPVDQWRHRFVAGLESVQTTMRRYGMLDEQVRLLKGYFADSLPNAPFTQLALARLDADSYESTMDALEHLYPKMATGGYVIIDDWNLEKCRQAVHDYRAIHGIGDPIHYVMGTKYPQSGYEAFWRVDRLSADSVGFAQTTPAPAGAGTFRRNTDGSWTCIAPSYLIAPLTRAVVNPGIAFRPGRMFLAMDLVARVETNRARDARPGA
jgi:hypothetical protein